MQILTKKNSDVHARARIHSEMRSLLADSLVLVLAVVLFTKGFLLMKLEIGHSTPSCSKTEYLYSNASESHCWSPYPNKFRYEKLVILIIDALRYDFAFYQEEDVVKLPFHNNMPIFDELLKKGCSKARLWRFKADAPTTTMQRLKGLTTGSLPTFIDLSRNFASSEITEDNFLDQFCAAGKNITFMGDDTWMGLFPGRFNKAFPYPSFDVKDLHLVDDGILEHLLPEIAQNDWQLLIAHFLGVDHCGHRYGPYHPQMPLKLQQMNDVVKNVVHSIDQKTLLLVMGDHGMTTTGDHGGETFNEVNAALFAYSPAGGFKQCREGNPRNATVNQVDIVPTISLLMGTAIPFANLGVLIGDMFPATETRSDVDQKLHEAMFVNAQQIHAYLTAYQEITSSLPHDIFEDSIKQYDKLNKPGLARSEEKFVKYMKSAKEMCQMVWAKFNVGLMLSALALLVLWLTACARCHIVHLHDAFTKVYYINSALLLMSTVISFTVPSSTNSVIALVIFCISLGSFCALVLALLINARWSISFSSTLFPVFMLILFSISFTTNSFILNEDVTVLYLFNSSFLFILLELLQQFSSTVTAKLLALNGSDFCKNSLSSQEKSSELIHRRKILKPPECVEDLMPDEMLPLFSRSWLKVGLYFFIAMICSRLSFLLRRCRAEQFWCFEENDIADGASKFRLAIVKASASFISLICCACGISSTFKSIGLKNFFMFRILGLASVLCCFAWFAQLTPSEITKILPEWFPTVFPRFVYGILTVFFLLKWADPVHVLCLSDNSSSKCETDHVQSEDKDVPRPARIDIATSMSISISTTTLGLCILFCLLLGSEMAAAIPLWIVSTYCVLQLTSRLGCQRGTYIPFSHVIIWNMLSALWWFSTGHQTSISSIRWDAAFVGFQGNHGTNIIPAILLLLDTFSMQVLSSVSLPLLILWRDSKQSGLCSQSERFDEHKDADILNDLFRKHLCFHVAKIIGCMAAACLHRRHLMVWWIFAPRYLFESISLVIVVTASFFSYANVCNMKKRTLALVENSTKLA